MKARNQDLLCRFVEEILNCGNMHFIEEIVSEHHILHGTDGDLYGQQGMRIMVMEYRTGFPDLSVATHDFAEDGNWIACRFVFSGTHLGPYRGIPASGSRVEVMGTVVDHIKSDHLFESWINIDGLGLAGQLTSRTGNPARMCEKH